MKYEVILKVKQTSSSSFEQAGKIVVPGEHLNAQFDAYKSRVKKMDVCLTFKITSYFISHSFSFFAQTYVNQ